MQWILLNASKTLKFIEGNKNVTKTLLVTPRGLPTERKF